MTKQDLGPAHRGNSWLGKQRRQAIARAVAGQYWFLSPPKGLVSLGNAPCRQLPEHVLQNPAMLVVERFLGRINSDLSLEGDVFPIGTTGVHLDHPLRRKFFNDRSQAA